MSLPPARLGLCATKKKKEGREFGLPPFLEEATSGVKPVFKTGAALSGWGFEAPLLRFKPRWSVSFPVKENVSRSAILAGRFLFIANLVLSRREIG